QTKKKVTFEVKDGDIIETDDDRHNTSNTSIESYIEMKDVVLKKLNLDLSPNFVYSKNQLRKNVTNIKTDNVTSKFFQTDRENILDLSNQKKRTGTPPETIQENLETIPSHSEKSEPSEPQSASHTESSARADQVKPIGDFTFHGGPKGIPGSFDLSFNIADEDGDSDYPPCVDSSLLLSPKADEIPTTNIGNEGNKNLDLPQEGQSFLSGLRKTGSSFFGQMTGRTDAKPNTEAKNFKFSFGGEDKKVRGGFFNMFR
ncbi:unnamed protein product, partial [Leptidea sinapis]